MELLAIFWHSNQAVLRQVQAVAYRESSKYSQHSTPASPKSTASPSRFYRQSCSFFNDLVTGLLIGFFGGGVGLRSLLDSLIRINPITHFNGSSRQQEEQIPQLFSCRRFDLGFGRMCLGWPGAVFQSEPCCRKCGYARPSFDGRRNRVSFFVFKQVDLLVFTLFRGSQRGLVV